MKRKFLFLVLISFVLSGCEKDELSSFSYIRDFARKTIARDTIPDQGIQDSVFYGYRNRCYYQTNGGAGFGKSLYMFGADGRWMKETRSAGSLKMINGQIQFENIMGRMVVLNAASGELEESITPISDENFQLAFYYSDSVFSVYRETGRCVLASRGLDDGQYEIMGAVHDNETPVEPVELFFYERNNRAMAIWRCEAMDGGDVNYWIIKNLNAPYGSWFLESESSDASLHPIFAGHIFYYYKSPNLLLAQSLTGDSLVWQKDDFPGSLLAVNSKYLYCKTGSSLQILNRNNGNLVHSASFGGGRYFYEESFVLNLLPDEFRVLDPKNLRELKAFPNNLKYLAQAGNAGYVFAHPESPEDTTFLQLMRIDPR